MSSKIGKYLLFMALAFPIWLAIWSVLALVPIFAMPLVWNASFAKVFGLFVTLVMMSKAGKRFSLLRL